ncbi:MAG: TonB-dependent receptor, partial [Chitinophagaceae bacterium]
MCKERIEAAAKTKGVYHPVWNAATQQLTLQYDATKTSIQKIEQRILKTGHDVASQKAPDNIYNALPACCLYRHNLAAPTAEPRALPKDSLMLNEHEKIMLPSTNKTIKGVVLASDEGGNFTALAGASIIWLQSNKGVVTDSNGVFSILQTQNEHALVISHAGYTPDTIDAHPSAELKIILGNNKQLSEVVLTSKQRSTYVSMLNPIRMQVMTEKELFKAACCNLSESFETNPSVDVSYNDAVTGSKQIQLLGLSGNYTQLTVENLPGPRGIATPLGLNSIAGPWVESIQLTKGIGSVANGYESIAGQINVELKKPENSEAVYANAYISDIGKTDFNLNLAKAIGKKWWAGLLLHDAFLTNHNIDFNKDGFRDQPTGNLFSLINRWKYDDGKGFQLQFGVKILNDRKTGGEVDYKTRLHKNGTQKYGLGINTDRYEVFAKAGYVFADKKYKSIGLQLSGISHRHDAYFGLTNYDAAQQNYYANLIYQSIIGNTNHKFRTGLSFLYDNYDENFNALNFTRTEKVPGAFFEYTYTASDKLSVVAGIRGDHNNLFGYFTTPRLHLKYEPMKGTTIRASVGRGTRTANIFAENSSVFVSARQVNILNALPGKAYGLNPEVAWNKGVSVDQKFTLFKRGSMLSVDFFRNDFSNQVVVDVEDPRLVKFYNLQGKSYSNSLQAELSLEPLPKLELRLAYRYFDVKTTYSGKLMQRPLIAGNRAFANVAYALSTWRFDYTINYNGKKRIPSTAANPLAYRRSNYSPHYFLMNAQ